MIVLGLILLLIAFLAKIAALWTVGIIVIVVGLLLLVLGAVNRPVGPRRWWW